MTKLVIPHYVESASALDRAWRGTVGPRRNASLRRAIAGRTVTRRALPSLALSAVQCALGVCYVAALIVPFWIYG